MWFFDDSFAYFLRRTDKSELDLHMMLICASAVKQKVCLLASEVVFLKVRLPGALKVQAQISTNGKDTSEGILLFFCE